MKKVFVVAIGAFALLSVQGQVKKPVAKVPVKPATSKPTAKLFKDNKDSASYALGARIAQNIKNQGFDGVNLALLNKAMSDVLTNSKLQLGDSVLDMCIGMYQQKIQSSKSAVAKAQGKQFLEANAKRKGVVVLPNGLQYEVIKAGTDTTKPSLSDKVKCHYHGTLINGTVFDSSVERGEPISFPLNGVIKGWQEALQLMTVGSKWKLFIPSELAYGDQQAGPTIAPGSTLVFEVELLGLEK
ncbi:MAG: FKBP-type peptidyl-prolyl cis-trans isomerase [Chitinophagaceae bacterium]|jgi:FKBP-type peptidyl-prolyl cis-trans isomerase FklB